MFNFQLRQKYLRIYKANCKTEWRAGNGSWILSSARKKESIRTVYSYHIKPITALDASAMLRYHRITCELGVFELPT